MMKIKEVSKMEKKDFKIDLAVFLIFFNRPDCFEKVFNAVKEARPSKLFLACDGARSNNDKDNELMNKCKEIASNIDWNCEVHTNYSEENLGCGRRMYSGVSWAFEYVDKLVVLEDDCVPHQDFFLFCKEMLDRYESNPHICWINGMNHLIKYEDTPYSYFFAQPCCWGWATWKRVWEKMDYDMKFLDDSYAMKCLTNKYPYYRNAIKTGNERRAILNSGGKLTAWTYQMGMSSTLNGEGIAITPKCNLISNVGAVPNSVHAPKSVKRICRRSQKYFNMDTYELDKPLKHPQYDIEDMMYYKKVEKKFRLRWYDIAEIQVRKILYR